MAKNVRVKSQVKQEVQGPQGPIVNRSRDSQVVTRRKVKTEESQMKFSHGQLMLFWGITALMMLCTFYFGYQAGRRSGSKAVLEQLADRTHPLKIYAPRSDYAETVEHSGIAISSESKKEAIAPKKAAEKIDFAKKDSLPKKPVEESIPEVSKKPAKEAKTIKKPKDKKSSTSKKSKSRIITAGPDTQNSSQKKPKYVEVYPGRDRFAPPRKNIEEVQQPVQIIEQPPVEILPPEPPKPKIEDMKPSSGWYVQVSAVRTEKEAMQMYDRIKSAGLSASLEPAVIRKRSLFRVLVGPYKNKKAAATKRTSAKKAAGVGSEPFIRQVQ